MDPNSFTPEQIAAARVVYSKQIPCKFRPSTEVEKKEIIQLIIEVVKYDSKNSLFKFKVTPDDEIDSFILWNNCSILIHEISDNDWTIITLLYQKHVTKGGVTSFDYTPMIHKSNRKLDKFEEIEFLQ
jgi:hypothetical protein